MYIYIYIYIYVCIYQTYVYITILTLLTIGTHFYVELPLNRNDALRYRQ